MNKEFALEEEEFLSDVGIDYVSIHNVFGIIAGGFDHNAPTKTEFNLMMQFILFLYLKYKSKLVCLQGPNMIVIKKSPEDLISWLKIEYNKGNYNRIDYGVWFDLDESVIPKEYLPKKF